jgi:hypothetical protein
MYALEVPFEQMPVLSNRIKITLFLVFIVHQLRIETNKEEVFLKFPHTENIFTFSFMTGFANIISSLVRRLLRARLQSTVVYYLVNCSP